MPSRANGSAAGVEIAPQLPNYQVAEKTLLGVVLLNNSALDGALRRGLVADDFFLPEHRNVFESIARLHQAGDAIDAVTVTEDLHRAGKLEASGGPAYIAQLADGIPHAMNCDHYVAIIRDKAALRRVIKTAEAIKERAFEASDRAAAIVEDAAKDFAALREISSPDSWRTIFHTFDEFESARPLSFAIKGFLQNNGATMIGGLSGDGKTLMLISIAKALLAGKGRRLWDLFEVEEESGRVLYLIPECAIEPFKHRLKLFGIYPYLAPDCERLLVRTLSKGPTPSLSDPRILTAAKGAHVILDTAVRFAEGDENSSQDNSRGLAADIFALLGAGARSVIAAHHSPKPFLKENVMRLENVLRGSGDLGAMLTTAWGVKQIDEERNVIHIENIKPRDFQPCGPFQIIGRPYIDEEGDFRLHKAPGECGTLANEQPELNTGGARPEVRQEKSRRIEMAREFLRENPNQTAAQLQMRFKKAGVEISEPAAKKYRYAALERIDE